MTATLTWRDVEGLARELADRFPGEDPLAVDFRRLRDLVLTIPSFCDEPDIATDETLEEIQAAWYEASSS
ncbi:MAG TPA: Fe-S cluster assembly protein IscX [Bacteroidota bacterium]|nr:Fe-S cluster assembly protein IscX [Bacteroidota bacterium]